MLGVLVVILRPDYVAGLSLSLGLVRRMGRRLARCSGGPGRPPGHCTGKAATATIPIVFGAARRLKKNVSPPTKGASGRSFASAIGQRHIMSVPEAATSRLEVRPSMPRNFGRPAIKN